MFLWNKMAHLVTSDITDTNIVNIHLLCRCRRWTLLNNSLVKWMYSQQCQPQTTCICYDEVCSFDLELLSALCEAARLPSCTWNPTERVLSVLRTSRAPCLFNLPYFSRTKWHFIFSYSSFRNCSSVPL